MKPEHEAFLFSLVGTETGRKLQEVFESLVDALYSSRGKNADSVMLDQKAAAFLEVQVLSRLKQQEQKKPDNDYK